MTDRHWTQRILAWVALPALVLGIAGAWFTQSHESHFGSVAFAADMSKAEFEQRVRDYLLEHPEVIGDALNRLEAKQGEQEAATAQIALKAHAAEVFQDPDSPVSGNSNGNVTLVEFFDYNCHYCRAMAPLMSQAEAADPQLRIVYKEFPILGPGSVFAAKAALAANRQGKYVALYRALYQVRGSVDEAKVLEAAGTVGLDVARMKADMQDTSIENELDKNGKLGQVLNITCTPGFVVGDQIAIGATDLSGLQNLIRGARSSQPIAK